MGAGPFLNTYFMKFKSCLVFVSVNIITSRCSIMPKEFHKTSLNTQPFTTLFAQSYAPMLPNTLSTCKGLASNLIALSPENECPLIHNNCVFNITCAIFKASNYRAVE